ncbi:MAG: hypothetical protein KC445_06725 [Anaerolineales bacterium]|nr:hypothetical protein [Anaerolineales bacterium]
MPTWFTNGRNPAIFSLMNNETITTTLIVLGFFVIFPLFWSVIVYLISRLGGWGSMAESYPYHEPRAAECFSMQSAIVRLTLSYKNVLKVCADEEGVYFSMLFLFRPGHSPFFVPWEEITGTKKLYLFYPVVELRFQRTPNLPFRLYKRTADRLVGVANGRWTYTDA